MRSSTRVLDSKQMQHSIVPHGYGSYTKKRDNLSKELELYKCIWRNGVAHAGKRIVQDSFVPTPPHDRHCDDEKQQKYSLDLPCCAKAHVIRRKDKSLLGNVVVNTVVQQ